jgi:hypothetical protein
MKLTINPRMLAMLSLIAGAAGAQVGSSLQTINLSAVKGQIVTLGAPNPGTQSLTITDNAINAYTAPFAITVTWDVTNSASTTVKLVGYFSAPTQALSNGASYIPASRVEVSTNGGSTWSAFTGSAVGGVGVAGGSSTLYTSPVTQGTNALGTSSVTFLVRLNLVGVTTTAGVYSGTLNLMAICN